MKDFCSKTFATTNHAPPSPYLQNALQFSFLFFSFFLGLHLQPMEVPRPGVLLELRRPAYTTAAAMPDPNRVCNLHHSSRQGIEPATSWFLGRIHFRCAMMGTLKMLCNFVLGSSGYFGDMRHLPPSQPCSKPFPAPNSNISVWPHCASCTWTCSNNDPHPQTSPHEVRTGPRVQGAMHLL